MSSSKASPFALLLIISILGLITAVLISPAIDLPDTAFQRNTAPLSIHALTHSAQHSDANSSALSSQFASLEAVPISSQTAGLRPVTLQHPHSAGCSILRC